MRNIKNPMLITFEEIPPEQRWRACLSALENEYTLSFRDICKSLKCSRSWATRYIKPHLHYIYLSNGAGMSPNYRRIANKLLNTKNSENTWYSETEFKNLIQKYITSITRQTISIPIEELIDKNMLNTFLDQYISLNEIKEAIKTLSPKDAEDLIKRRNEVFLKCTTQKGKKLWDDYPDPYKRTDTPAIKCTLDNIDVNSFMAVHDLKDYGDIDEEIYRDLFKQGCYKIVLCIPDTDGVTSEKIFYINSDDQFEISNSKEMLLVKYSNYVSL